MPSSVPLYPVETIRFPRTATVSEATRTTRVVAGPRIEPVEPHTGFRGLVAILLPTLAGRSPVPTLDLAPFDLHVGIGGDLPFTDRSPPSGSDV
jgi:hypothetical protein